MLIENKNQLFSELKKRYAATGVEVTMSDSIMIKRGDSITKIPMQACNEEVFIIQTIRALGIPTVEITNIQSIKTGQGMLPSYTMTHIPDAVDVIKFGNKFLNSDYYSFLEKVFEGLRSVSFKGFGAIQLTNSGINFEYDSDKKLLESVLRRTQKCNYWPTDEITKLKTELNELPIETEAVLSHTDILHNVLVKENDNQFYLIDPQTIVSAANPYWDLSYYLIYANGYQCTSGLAEFIRRVGIADWDLFFITARINSMERISFYYKYDPTRLSKMMKFHEGLSRNVIITGGEELSKGNL